MRQVPKAKVEPLQQLTDQVFRLDTMDATSFKKFFVWVSDVIGLGGKSVGTTDSIELPGPPEEVNIDNLEKFMRLASH